MDVRSQYYYYYFDICVVLTACCVTLLCEVPRQQQNVSFTEQLDAANNNARQKASSRKCLDAENNNVGSESSPYGHSINSSMSRDPTQAAQNGADDGIQIMPYTDFVRSRMAHGLAPPRGIVVRRNGRPVLVPPQYVVQQHRQHRAHVRSLRRHGYESEDGRIAGHHHTGRGYDLDQHQSNTGRHHKRAAAGLGYESDIGYRSDVAGYYSSRHGPRRTTAYPNPSVYSADFTSGDWRYGSDRNVYRQKAPSSSGFMVQSGRNIPPYERNVQETITEEVMNFEGQPEEQSQEWPSSVQVPVRSQFTNQYLSLIHI